MTAPLATNRNAEGPALLAIERLRMSGRRAILLTGRRVDDLLAACPRLGLFDYVVAENGALIYDPRTREQTLLGKPPPAEFVQRLRELTGNSIEVGKVVVGTWLPHDTAVLQAIQEMGLELHIVFNKTAVKDRICDRRRLGILYGALSKLATRCRSNSRRRG